MTFEPPHIFFNVKIISVNNMFPLWRMMFVSVSDLQWLGRWFLPPHPDKHKQHEHGSQAMNSDVSLIGLLLSVLIYKCIEAAFSCHAHYKQLDMALALQLAHNYFSLISVLCVLRGRERESVHAATIHTSICGRWKEDVQSQVCVIVADVQRYLSFIHSFT